MLDITVAFSHDELSIIRICLDVVLVEIPSERENGQFLSLVSKLTTAYEEQGDSPYDKWVKLTEDETDLIDNSLHLAMCEASLAASFDDPQFTLMLDHSLITSIPMMRALLRRLQSTLEMAALRDQMLSQETRLSQLESRAEAHSQKVTLGHKIRKILAVIGI